MRPPRTSGAAKLLSSTSKLSQTSPHLYHRPRCLFHTTPAPQARRKPTYKSISQQEIERITAERAKSFKPYTEAEKEELARRYTPAQLAAIEAGEKAIAYEDLATQAKPRTDPFVPDYVDDFSRIDGGVADTKIEKLRGEGQDYEDVRPLTDDETRIADEDEGFDVMYEAMSKPFKGNLKLLQDHETGQVYYDSRSLGQYGKNNTRPKPPEETDDFLKPYGGVTEEDKETFSAALQEPDEYDSRLHGTDLKAAGYLPIDVPYLEHFFASHSGKPFIPPQSPQPGPPPPQQHEANNALLIADLLTVPTYYDRVDSVFPSLSEPDVAPNIPKFHDPAVVLEETSDDSGEDDETAAAFARVARATGQTVEQLRRYRVKLLVQRSVVNQTRMGKVRSMYYLLVVGNERGQVGLGEGKATEPDQARRMAHINALGNIRSVRRYENRTIYGDVEAKVGAAVVRLSARRPGFGLRCSEKIFEIARCAGLADLAASIPRSKNKMNVAKATLKALLSQKDPEEIAKGRGRKLVDVRKVYYSGLV